MSRLPPRRTGLQLPTYALYGEAPERLGIDWLHCESIAERSQLHDWEIRPHRHTALLQVLYVRRGRGQVLAEGATQPLRGATLVIVPPMTAHGFSFTPGVEGLVVTIAEQHARSMLAQEPSLRSLIFRFQAEALGREASVAIDRAATDLWDEYRRSGRWRSLAIDASLSRLLVAIGRLPLRSGEREAPELGRADEHVERFRGVIERRFREHPPIAACARELSITPTQLNRVCQRVLGRNALAVLHARIVLEAQRELAYTTMSIKQIGLGLGFGDAAYFTRFFERTTGMVPSNWRRRSTGSIDV